MAQVIPPINVNILKQCREQLALSLDVVKSKMKFIDEFENNEKVPTLKQLSILADLYEVPRWVFIADELPKEYQYNTPPFRRMQGADIESHSKIHKLIARIEQYRKLFLELRADMDNPISEFVAPYILDDPVPTAVAVRQWLSLTEPLDFDGLRQKLEDKDIFVFCTNKYTHWSNINNTIRGISIFYNTLPLIIINGSDYRKAQSFTLLYELGHVLRKKTVIDAWKRNSSKDENIDEIFWCNMLASSVLMPEDWFADESFDDLGTIKNLAKKIKVSPYTCLVRARQLNKINQNQYVRFQSILKAEYDEFQKKLKDAKGGPARNIVKEVKKQFNCSFIRAVINSYHQEYINLHQSTKILDLKTSSHFLELARDM